MPLTDYEVDNKLKALAPVLDEQAEWFGRLVLRLFYPAQDEIVSPPESFKNWLSGATDDFITQSVRDDLIRLYDELHEMADELTRDAARGVAPLLVHVETLINLHEDFLMRLRRIERDCVQADSGLDVLTGLRNRKAMDVDLERELERRARQGKPFCLVIARIDSYDEILKIMGEDQTREVVRQASRLIKKCVRSFDDAYHPGEAEFVMALKHSDTTGGTAAIARLRGYLEEDPILVTPDGSGKPVALTMSYCAGEPVPGDSLAEFLKNMRADLKRYEEGGGTTLEYLEQSPLQRYINLAGEDG